MKKLPSITLIKGGSYIVIANSIINVGLPGVYIVYACGNPMVIYKMLKEDNILGLDIYYQLENIAFLKNHSEIIANKDGATLYKYKRN